MDKPIRRLFLFFAVLFVALIVQLTYVQVWAAPRLKTHPANTRAIAEEMKIDRGDIISADGVKLATSRQKGEYYFREYPQGDLVSPWLGYNSTRYGRAGIERVYNQELSGQIGLLGLRTYWDQLLERTHEGAHLKLTIDLAVQRAAAKALGDKKGAVVALDPRTGAILAMVSYPRFDPNHIEEQWKELNSDPAAPLLNRAIYGLYPPGSVFKTVVVAAALERGVANPETEFEDTGSVKAGGFVVNNYGGQVYGKHNLVEAFAKSINTTFAKIGVALGSDALASYASAFGFGQDLPWRLGGAVSRFPAQEQLDKAHLAQVSYGQGELLATPLEMALVAAGVANKGTIMKPYVVSQVLDPNGDVISQTNPSEWLRPISPNTAKIVTDLMVAVVEKGTGTRAALSGVKIAGKTGTAEVAGDSPHAWFIGFAPAFDPKVAVAVLVENGGSGGITAAPIAREVIAAVLRR